MIINDNQSMKTRMSVLPCGNLKVQYRSCSEVCQKINIVCTRNSVFDLHFGSKQNSSICGLLTYIIHREFIMKRRWDQLNCFFFWHLKGYDSDGSTAFV